MQAWRDREGDVFVGKLHRVGRGGAPQLNGMMASLIRGLREQCVR